MAERSILAATGDLAKIADAVVTAASDLTEATAGAMLEMQGGQWITIATTGIADWPLAVPLSLREIPNHPVLVEDPTDRTRPLSAIARQYGLGSYAAVPIHLWPVGPALLLVWTTGFGQLARSDLAVLSLLSVSAGAAAYHTPLPETRLSRPLEQLGWQQATLEAIARGAPLGETLNRMGLEMESRYPGVRCSVLLADAERTFLRHAAAPSLPPALCELIDGLPIRPGSAACGSAAATLRPVVIEDIFTDEKTSSFISAAEASGLRSVWAYPLLDSKNQIVGTFALYREEIHRPDAAEMGDVAGVASLAALAIERSQTESALTRAAQVDPLTGLPNRARFSALLGDALYRAQRTATHLAVIFLDLDGFKVINDALGHEAGDRMLVEVAQRLVQSVGSPDAIARFGGDEFTVLLENVAVGEAERCADRIAESLQEPFMLDGGAFTVTTAVGIAMSGGEDLEPGSVIRDADAAMYSAKTLGRGKRAVFDAALRERAVARVAMEAELRRAVEGRDVHVHYQPIVSLITAQWCGVEALARWHHPDLGNIPPSEFIGLAEEIGLVSRLGEQILSEVGRQIRAWEQAGLTIPVAVNVSAIQLADVETAEDMLRVVRACNLGPDRITFEITESTVMHRPDLARNLLAKLRDEGIPAVIDDFGTGHSSIARLNELPTIGIKIDKSFTSALLTDPVAVTVVNAVIQLAHAFNLVVTAEGVETPVQLQILHDLGCDQAQGFLFARPAPADTIAELLAEPPKLPLAAERNLS